MNTTNYTRVYRIIHWAMAIGIFLILFTIFLRLTWMNKHNVAEIIQTYLSKEGIAITQDQTISLAKQIRKPMWTWHIYLGYFLSAVIGIRFLLPLFGSMKFQNPLAKDLTPKLRVQKWTYVVFYIGVAITLFSGLMMKFGPENMGERAEKMHVLALYYLIPFIVLHIGGILVAEFTNQKGIISRIVRGSKEN